MNAPLAHALACLAVAGLYGLVWLGPADYLAAVTLLLLGLTALGVAALERARPALAARAEAALARVPAAALPVALGAAWVVGWAWVLHARDPGWIASGIDWHDSLLDAYALRHDDPPFYCAWRYPLFPALGVVVADLSGASLGTALQVVSRVLLVLLPIPLAIVGRALFGRAAVWIGVALLLALPTYQHHVDAVTPYPTYMACVAWLVAGLTLAVQGRLGGFAVYGIALGAALATDAKSLPLALATLPLATLVAVFAPAWTAAASAAPSGAASSQGAAVRSRGVSGLLAVLLRGARIALVVAPIALSYAWMGALPVRPQVLEEMSGNTLFPAGLDPAEKQRITERGYVWGDWDGWDQVPRTLQVFAAYGRLPEMEAARAHRLSNTPIKARRDYPGTTLRVLAVAFVGLLLAPLAPGRTRGDRARAVVVATAILAVASTCVPPLLNDYQDRYLAHALPFVPLGIAGAGSLLARLVVGRGTRLRAAARLVALGVAATFALGWSGNPLSLEAVVRRIEAIGGGGASEQSIRTWALANMEPGDLLLDTTWMMSALLVAGDHTVLREDPIYPPGGGASVAEGWRATKPWRPATGQAYAIVAQMGEPPLQGSHPWAPARIQRDPEWEVAARLTHGVLVYRYLKPGMPPTWRLPRMLAAAGAAR